jgi:hypothetical protein
MAKKMSKKRTPARPARSPKAGRPPQERAAPSRVKSRRRSATVAVRKDTELKQTDAGTQVRWGANQRRPQKV